MMEQPAGKDDIEGVGWKRQFRCVTHRECAPGIAVATELNSTVIEVDAKIIPFLEKEGIGARPAADIEKSERRSRKESRQPPLEEDACEPARPGNIEVPARVRKYAHKSISLERQLNLSVSRRIRDAQGSPRLR
jgi:hypothetical protein